MKRAVLVAGLALAGWCTDAASAADLPRAAPVAPVTAVVSSSDFYIGIIGGSGFPGTQQQGGTTTNEAFPSGAQVGGLIGYGGSAGVFTYGIGVEALYDFSRGNAGNSCVGVSCVNVDRKNGVLLQEGVELGINIGSFMGYPGGLARASHWSAPITVPASVWSNLVIAGRAGWAERFTELCSTVGGVTGCDSKFINAPYAGVKIKTMLAGQTEGFIIYDHVFWRDNTFDTVPGLPALVKPENSFKGGFAYHLSP